MNRKKQNDGAEMNTMVKIHFSDYFEVDHQVLDNYGAFNVSLIIDLPLFIDPFQLFNSDKPIYRRLHEDIIRYLKFLRDKSISGHENIGLLKGLYTFKEVKQNWFGFSAEGNRGRGLGLDFARSLNRNLHLIFSNFGEERLTSGSHLEKLCLIKDGIGRDNISDFTTNLIKEFLLRYTQTFAQKYVAERHRHKCVVEKVRFNYTTETWESGEFDLPFFNGEYVLLTPKDILTKDDVWINRTDLMNDFTQITDSVDNDQLRAQINNYFMKQLSRHKKPTQKQRKAVIDDVVEKYPELIEYYIRSKEKQGIEARLRSEKHVSESETLYIKQIIELVSNLSRETGFYALRGDSLEEARKRVEFLRDVIENKGGHRVFYVKGKPIKRESDLHIMYRLTWYGSPLDVSREVNDGRGPVDFKISQGSRDKSLVEFKLASNPQLKRNLDKQVSVYGKASDTKKSLKVILYFSEEELDRVEAILKDLGLTKVDNIILIDARADNKPSGSRA
jgi:hypothetical protein